MTESRPSAPRPQRELEPWQGTIGTGIALLVVATLGLALFLLAHRNRAASTADAEALVARLAQPGTGTITEGIAAGATLLPPDTMGGGLQPADPYLAGYREIRTETGGEAGKRTSATAVDYHALVPFKLGAITVGPATLDGDLSGCPGKSTDDSHMRSLRSGERVAALGTVVNGAITGHVELHCGDAAGWLADARAAADQPLSTLGLAGLIAAIVGGLGGLVQILRGTRMRKRP